MGLMSKGISPPYRLRLNKAVDRELFLSFLTRMAATLKIESYKYIGLGGAFLEDFRLIHARLGISKMVCVESEENVHKRQKFNRPIGFIECVHCRLENYIESIEYKEPVIIWFDFTAPDSVTDQILRFARTISQVPINSILRITLNANPKSLGEPINDEIAIAIDDVATKVGNKKTLQEWRLELFRMRFGNLFPSNLKPDGMTFKNYGKSILMALSIAVEKELLSCPDRKIVWSLATHYADGQPMVTVTLIVCDLKEQMLEHQIKDWEFYSTPDSPLLLDLPSLSTLERLTMESKINSNDKMEFELPISDMGGNPFESFKRFYRIFPHFSRVEL